jgi:hypothetical protein
MPPYHLERLMRFRAGYAFWYEFPTKQEADIRDHIMDEFGISKTQAYEDIRIIKILLGNIQKVTKEWNRHRFIAMIEESYKTAKANGDAKAMVMAADKFGKYTQLNIEDSIDIPWGEIINSAWEPTSDPTVIGLKPDPKIDEKIKNLKKKYSEDIEVEYIAYEDIQDRDQEDLSE